MLRTTFWILMAAAVAAAGEDNLVPNADFALDASGAPAGWKTWAPRPGLALDSRVVKSAGGNALSLAARSAIGYGSWVAVVAGIAGGTTYEFEALYRPLNVPREDVSVAAIVSWCGGESGENAIQRDYADRAAARDGWTRVSRTLTAPKGARSARIELVLRWSEGGSVMWKNVRLSEAPSRPPRFVRVATTRIAVPEPNSTLETNFNLISKMLDKAGEQRPDIVLLSENLADRWVDLPVEKTAEPVPGRLTALLGEKARKYRMYVATSLHENADGIIYNTGVLIGRNGEITGKYRKVHLPLEEAENGITPGGDYPVFETDFGRVGMMICYDYWFSEPARILRLNGAELLLLPIAGDGDRLHWDVISRARAIDNGVYLAASSTVAESSSAIIAPTGKVLSETSEDFGVAVSEIDLNREYRLLWLSVGAEGEARSLYIKERQPHTYGALAESNRTAK